MPHTFCCVINRWNIVNQCNTKYTHTQILICLFQILYHFCSLQSPLLDTLSLGGHRLGPRTCPIKENMLVTQFPLSKIFVDTLLILGCITGFLTLLSLMVFKYSLVVCCVAVIAMWYNKRINGYHMVSPPYIIKKTDTGLLLTTQWTLCRWIRDVIISKLDVNVDAIKNDIK